MGFTNHNVVQATVCPPLGPEQAWGQQTGSVGVFRGQGRERGCGAQGEGLGQPHFPVGEGRGLSKALGVMRGPSTLLIHVQGTQSNCQLYS